MSSDYTAPRQQHNYGSGTFVGRDLYKIETLDKKTKSVLEKLSKDAPALGQILAKALKDGVISPEAVFALETATRSINEDVAGALWEASRHINEDVASSLRFAGEHINEDVASSFHSASTELADVAGRIERAIQGIREASGDIESADAKVTEWGGVVRSINAASQDAVFVMQSQGTLRRGWSGKSFVAGLVVAIIVIVGILILWTIANNK